MQPASCHGKIQLSLDYYFCSIIIGYLTGFIPNVTSEMTESALPIIQVFHFHHIQRARAEAVVHIRQYSSIYHFIKV